MNAMDRNAALDATRERLDLYADKAGKKYRSQDARIIAAQQAGAVLTRYNGTIDWVGKRECPMGYSNIFEYMAGSCLPEKELKPMQRMEYVEDFTKIMKNGINGLKNAMMEDWGMVLYAVPRAEGSLLIEVITVHPDYVVNDLGQTAEEIATLRDNKMVKGQINSAYKRQAKILGSDEAARHRIVQLAQTVVALPSPEPTGTPDQPLI